MAPLSQGKGLRRFRRACLVCLKSTEERAIPLYGSFEGRTSLGQGPQDVRKDLNPERDPGSEGGVLGLSRIYAIDFDNY